MNRETITFYTPMNLRYGGGFEEWLKKTVDVLSDDFEINVLYGNIGTKLRFSESEIQTQFQNVNILKEIKHIKLLGLYFMTPKSIQYLYFNFKKSDYIYFNYAFVLQELYVKLASNLSKKNIIVGFHAPIYFSKIHDLLFNYFSSKILKKFFGFHSLNEETYTILKNKKFNNISRIANYVLSKDMSRPKKSGSVKIITFAGRYEDQKGIDVLIKAIPEIVKMNNNARFNFFGSGTYANNIKKLALAFPHNVFEYGFTINKNCIYNNADYVIIPSRQDQMSMTLLEAMSKGIIPIATHVPGANEVINDNSNGIFINDLSTDSIVYTVNRALMLKNNELNLLKDGAYELMKISYNEHIFKEKFINMIHKSKSI